MTKSLVLLVLEALAAYYCGLFYIVQLVLYRPNSVFHGLILDWFYIVLLVLYRPNSGHCGMIIRFGHKNARTIIPTQEFSKIKREHCRKHRNAQGSTAQGNI